MNKECPSCTHLLLSGVCPVWILRTWVWTHSGTCDGPVTFTDEEEGSGVWWRLNAPTNIIYNRKKKSNEMNNSGSLTPELVETQWSVILIVQKPGNESNFIHNFSVYNRRTKGAVIGFFLRALCNLEFLEEDTRHVITPFQWIRYPSTFSRPP